MRALIVNADDLGWSEGVNRGIAEAHRNGIVTSASLLANGVAFASAAKMARRETSLGVGVHLNLSDGPPLLPRWEVPSLVSDDGMLSAGPATLLGRILRGRLEWGEVEREWAAQIEKVRAAGIQPTHLDGHKHMHMLPGLFEIALQLARRFGIRAIRVPLEAPQLRAALSNAGAGAPASPARMFYRTFFADGLRLLGMEAPALARRAGIATADFFCGITQTGFLTQSGVVSLLANLPEGVTELMTHPGYAGGELARTPTRLQRSRQTELDILTAPALRNLVASGGIRLVNYASIAG